MIAKGATSFARDVQNGMFKDYDSWPGTDRPWERGDIPAPSATLPNNRSSLDVPIGSASASATTTAARNPTSHASSSDSPLSINDAYRLYLKRLNDGQSQAPAADVSAPSPPLVPDRQISFAGGNEPASSSSHSGAGFAPPLSQASDSQGSLSLNDAYLEYLRRLGVSQP